MTAENPNTIWLLRSTRNEEVPFEPHTHTQSHSKYTAHSSIQLPITLHSADASEDNDSIQSRQNPQTQQPPNRQSTLPSRLQKKCSTLITGDLLYVSLCVGPHFHSQETRLWGEPQTRSGHSLKSLAPSAHWRLGDGGMGVLLWCGSKVTVKTESCYGMHVRWWWYGSVVLAWKLGDGGNGVLLQHGS